MARKSEIRQFYLFEALGKNSQNENSGLGLPRQGRFYAGQPNELC